MSLNAEDKAKLRNTFEKLNIPKNRQNLILLLGISGIALIFFSGFFKSERCEECSAEKSEVSMEERQKNLEQNIESMVSSIEGAGKAKVLITFESACETVYATEEKKNKEASEDKSGSDITRKKQSDDCEKKLITVRDPHGGEKALAVTKLEPKVKGAVVICPGGDDPMVKVRVTEALTTALGITSARVCVTRSG